MYSCTATSLLPVMCHYIQDKYGYSLLRSVKIFVSSLPHWLQLMCYRVDISSLPSNKLTYNQMFDWLLF